MRGRSVLQNHSYTYIYKVFSRTGVYALQSRLEVLLFGPSIPGAGNKLVPAGPDRDMT